MNSFYGGQPGKDFKITKVFPNKSEVEKDLSKRWQSDIKPGEYILISYGSQYLTYEENLNIDIEKYKKSYNASLWQKIYIEEPFSSTDDYTNIETIFISEDYGLGYKLIAILTGNTPKIDGISKAIDANLDPYIEVNLDNKDNPIFTFYLPKSQILHLHDLEILDANEIPKISLDESDINNPYLTFSLPQSQVIGLGEILAIDANLDPSISINEENINRPKINFSLPKSQTLKMNPVTVLNANQMPTLDFNESDINNPTVTFSLPQSQVIGLDDTAIVGPKLSPKVELNSSNINNPKLKFTLPKAVQFFYGNLLGQSLDGTYTLNQSDHAELSNISIGDYYINTQTGFIYICTNISKQIWSFKYLACLSAPNPSIDTIIINPYENSGGAYKIQNPSVISSYEDEEEKTGWKLTFNLPKTPIFRQTVSFCGPEEDGQIVGAIENEANYLYNFTIPRGAKFFSGSQISGETSTEKIANAKKGDYYLNTNLESVSNGFIYHYNGSSWIKTGSIKGPTGKPLNVVATYEISYTQVPNDTPSEIGNYIYNQYGKYPSSDQIIAVNYTNSSDIRISYWYYYINNEWNRALLTGGVSGFIEDEYDPANDINKAYSINYINKLIANNINIPYDEKNRKTYSALQIENLIESWGSFSDILN